MSNIFESTAKRKNFLLLIPLIFISLFIPGFKKNLNPNISKTGKIKPEVHPLAVQRQKKA